MPGFMFFLFVALIAFVVFTIIVEFRRIDIILREFDEREKSL